MTSRTDRTNRKDRTNRTERTNRTDRTDRTGKTGKIRQKEGDDLCEPTLFFSETNFKLIIETMASHLVSCTFNNNLL